MPSRRGRKDSECGCEQIRLRTPCRNASEHTLRSELLAPPDLQDITIVTREKACRLCNGRGLRGSPPHLRLACPLLPRPFSLPSTCLHQKKYTLSPQCIRRCASCSTPANVPEAGADRTAAIRITSSSSSDRVPDFLGACKVCLYLNGLLLSVCERPASLCL